MENSGAAFNLLSILSLYLTIIVHRQNEF